MSELSKPIPSASSDRSIGVATVGVGVGVTLGADVGMASATVTAGQERVGDQEHEGAQGAPPRTAGAAHRPGS